VISEKNC